MKLKAMFTAVLALSTLLGGFAMAEAADKNLKIHFITKDDPYDNPGGAAGRVFENLVESGTNGTVNVQLFPNSQLGKDAEVLQQVKAGMIQAGMFSMAGIASMYPLIGVIDVPFVFPDIASTHEVLDGPFGQKLMKDLEAKTGLKCLGFSDSGGFFQITNSKRPIKTLDDMKGLKIRVMPSETHKKIVESLGAQPASIAWTELYTALQTGVADGQINPVSIVAYSNFDEVQKYITLVDMLFAPHILVMNQKFWDSLTPAEQDVVSAAAKSSFVAARGISRITDASDKGLPKLAKKMQINSLTPEEREKFRAAAQPALIEYIETTYGPDGKALLEEFMAAVKDVRAKK